MAINYAEKFSPIVDEAFRLSALTNAAVNNDYDWIGVETVKVYSIPTVAMNNYDVDGAHPFARYGTPGELQNTVQELQLTQDRSFTFTIDRKSEQDTVGVMSASAALARQIEQVVIPEVDTYRIAKMFSSAGNTKTETVTASNAYATFLAVQEMLDDDKAPQAGRLCFATPAYINFLKLDSAFVKTADLATRVAFTGQVGEVDGVAIIKVPTSYFPAKANFVITNRLAMPAPIKLTEYKIHTDAPGISGSLVEGRIRYDAFVLNNKANAIGACSKSGT